MGGLKEIERDKGRDRSYKALQLTADGSDSQEASGCQRVHQQTVTSSRRLLSHQGPSVAQVQQVLQPRSGFTCTVRRSHDPDESRSSCVTGSPKAHRSVGTSHTNQSGLDREPCGVTAKTKQAIYLVPITFGQ